MEHTLELYEDAMTILTDPARTFDGIELGILIGYISAMHDEITELQVPRKLVTLQDYAKILMGMYQSGIIFEDKQMGRIFGLLCLKVIEVAEMW